MPCFVYSRTRFKGRFLGAVSQGQQSDSVCNGWLWGESSFKGAAVRCIWWNSFASICASEALKSSIFFSNLFRMYGQLAIRPKANPFLETHSCNRHPLPRGTTEGRSSRTCEFSIHVEFQWIVKWGKSWIAWANQNTTPEKIKSNGFSTQSIHVRRSAAELSDDGRSSSLPRAVCYIQQPSLLWRNAIPSAMKVCSFPAMLQFLSAALCVFLKYFDD